nr:ABC transporter ATP-binding protein [uncultured Acetatifactor sp.]
MESAFSSLAYILEHLHPTIMTLLSAALFEAAGNCLAGDGGTAGIYVYPSIVILYFIVYNILRSFSSICINAGVYEKAMFLLKDDLAEAASRLPLVRFEDGEMLARRKRAQECVQNDRIPGIFMLLIVLTTSVAGILSLLAALWAYHPLLPIIAAASVAQFFLSHWLLEREGYRLEEAVTGRKRQRDYIWSLFTSPGNVKEMRVMGFDGYLADRWKEERDSVNEAQWRLDRKKSRYHLLCDAVKTLGYLTGVAFCLWLLREGMISAPVFGACLVAFASVQDVVGNFFGSLGKIPGFLGLAADYFAFIDDGAPEQEGLLELSEPIRAIELKDVSFRYPHGGKEAVKSVSLTIRQGEVVALVGANGSGKTTLVKLLLGIYLPERGEVRYNGTDLRRLRKESLYRHAALLTQDFALYNLTLAENVALADIGRVGDRERVREVLRRVDMDGGCCGAEDWGGCRALRESESQGGGILGREFGGPAFSEGQKQRLALARVLFADRELVILDEPTSALDPLQENRILEEFLRLSGGRTTIIISHRVGLCRQVDKIAVMQDGSIAEWGSHEQLMAEGGAYRKLYDMQSRWYTDTADAPGRDARRDRMPAETRRNGRKEPG